MRFKSYGHQASELQCDVMFGLTRNLINIYAYMIPTEIRHTILQLICCVGCSQRCLPSVSQMAFGPIHLREDGQVASAPLPHTKSMDEVNHGRGGSSLSQGFKFVSSLSVSSWRGSHTFASSSKPLESLMGKAFCSLSLNLWHARTRSILNRLLTAAS